MTFNEGWDNTYLHLCRFVYYLTHQHSNLQVTISCVYNYSTDTQLEEVRHPWEKILEKIRENFLVGQDLNMFKGATGETKIGNAR